MDVKRALAGVAVGAIVLAGAGCGASPDKPNGIPASASPSPTSTLTPEQQAAFDKAWAAFLALDEIYTKAAQTGVYDFADDRTKRPLYPYAAGTYRSALERDLDLMQQRGVIRTGRPKTELVRIVAAEPTSISVEVCIDNSGTDTVNKQTGESVQATGQNQRYPGTLRAGLFEDGSWRWVEAQVDRSQTC